MAKPRKKASSEDVPFKATVGFEFPDGTEIKARVECKVVFDKDTKTFGAQMEYRSADNPADTNNALLLAVMHAFAKAVAEREAVKPKGKKKGGK